MRFPFSAALGALLCSSVFSTSSSGGVFASQSPSISSQRLLFNHPELTVDLGVGLWAQPFPLDFDGDGDHDLLVATADVPYNGIYFFENPEGDVKFPVFKPGVRLGKAFHNLRVSYSGDDTWELVAPEKRYPDFINSFLERPAPIPYSQTFYSGRDNQWSFVDYDGDGVRDLVVGASDWREYGWDNAFNEKGEWTNGPLHAFIYFMRNAGTEESPSYREALKLEAAGKPIDVYGAPSPCFADFDGDGDLDLVCAEFLDRFTYFENIGTRTEPAYAEGRFLQHKGEVLRIDLQMPQVVAFDWDKDGDTDLVVGEEDGRVNLIENEGKRVAGLPSFLPPKFFQQQAHFLKFGALSTPSSVDWDGDGDEDLIAGNTAGYLGFIENLDGGDPPKWAAPVYLKTGDEVFRVQAGPNGSIQGPCEAKWGYTAPCVADWSADGLPDIVFNSIWGNIEWLENVGTREAPSLAVAKPIEVEWQGSTPKPAWCWWNPLGKELVTQWRTTPFVCDLNGDGLADLVLLDPEGYLVFHERTRKGDGLKLLPGRRLFHDPMGSSLRLNPGIAGKSGRRKFVLTDWDGDRKLDLLLNSRNIDFLRNIAQKEGEYVFRNLGELDDRILAGHTTCPTTVDWDKNGIPDLVIGAEDGFFYYLKNPSSR